ncbi:MgtC/SapB family protein [Candidatus Altiarchaeota archaeon]
MIFDHLVIELTMIFKIVVAAFFGLLVGLERRGGQAGAGSRTFSLISMGACVFTVLSIHGFQTTGNPERLVAQIITGVGFIGGGVIWRAKNDIIHGITTAAGIWMAAGIGIAIGLDYYLLAVFSMLLTMIVLSKGHPVSEAKGNLVKLMNCMGKDK